MSHHTTEAWLKSNPEIAAAIDAQRQVRAQIETNVQGFTQKEEVPTTGTANKSKWLTDPVNPPSQYLTQAEIDPSDAMIDTKGSWGQYMKNTLSGINPRLADDFSDQSEDVNIMTSKYEPTTAELEAINSSGLLFDPRTGEPRYTLTKEFRQKMAREGAPIKAAGIAGGIVLGAFEEIGKQARFGGEIAIRDAFDIYTDEELAEFQKAIAQKEEELGRSLDPYEYRVVFDESFGATDLPDIPTSMLPFSDFEDIDLNARNLSNFGLEMLLPATKIDKAFDLAVLGGFRGLKYIGGSVQFGARKTEVAGAVQDVANSIQPPENNVFNLPEIKVSNVKQENIINSVKSLTGSDGNNIYTNLAKQIQEVRQQTKVRSENLANSMSAELDYSAKQAFDIQPNGQITKLPKVDDTYPTLADIGANYEFYKTYLNSAQKEVMEDIRARLSPIKKSLKDMDIEYGQRIDIKKGGFYIPRGGAFTQQQLAGEAVTARKKSNFGKTATETSEAAGIKKGLTYTPFRDAMQQFVTTAGDRIGNKYTARILKEARDEDGKLINSSELTRIKENPVYAETKQAQKDLRRLRDKFLNSARIGRNTKKIADQAAKNAEKNEEAVYREIQRVSNRGRIGQDVSKAETRALNAEGRFDDFAGKFNVADLKLARQKAKSIILAARDMGKAIEANRQKLLRATNKSSKADDELLRQSQELDIILNNLQRLMTTSTRKPTRKFDAPQEITEEIQQEIDETLNKLMDLQRQVSGTDASGNIVKGVTARSQRDPLNVSEFKDGDESLITPIMGKIARRQPIDDDEVGLLRKYRKSVKDTLSEFPKNTNAKIRQEQLDLLPKPVRVQAIPVDAPIDLGDVYAKILKLSDQATDKYDDLLNKANELDAKVDDLLDEEEVLKGVDKLLVQANREVRDQEKALYEIAAQEERLAIEFKLAEREFNRIEKLNNRVTEADIKRLQDGAQQVHGQAAKLNKNVAKALLDTANAREAFKETKEIYDDLAAELFWVKAKAKPTAEQVKIGAEAMRKMPELTGVDFPAEFAHQVNKIIEKEIGIKGPLSPYIKAFQWHAGLWRSLRATLDLSAPAIHGLLRLFDNPVMAGKAFAWQWQAWGAGGDEVLGKFLAQFNKEAKSKGTLTTDQWSALGVRIGGADTEFTIGKQKFTEFLQKAPGIKQANRAFGYYGDYLRINWADELAQEFLQEGRTLDEIMNGELGQQIAEAVNTATGYANKRFGGELGDMLTFAPRFFQARLTNIARAGTGTVKGGRAAISDVTSPATNRLFGTGDGLIPKASTSKATPQERIARRSMLRLISQGTLLTVGINAALGQETDFDLLTKNKKGEWIYNSNFMRIRFANRDWSIFGTYDSMVRLLIMSGIGLGTLNHGNVLSGMRGIASGPVSLGWDFVSGSTFEGMAPKAGWAPSDPEFMPGDDVLKTVGFIAESHLPFAADQIPEITNLINEGKVGEGLAMAAGEFMGGKSAPMSYTDLLHIISKEKLEAGVTSPTARVQGEGWDVDDLSDGELDIIKEDPRMKEMLETFTAREKDELGSAFEGLKINFESAEQTLIESMASADGERLATLIRDLKRNRANIYKNFEDRNTELLAEIETEEEDLNRADYWAQKFFNVEMDIYQDSGYMDFDKFEEERNKIIEEASKENPAYAEYITGRGLGTFRGERFGDENVRALVEEYDSDVEIMRQYWDVTKRVAQFYGYEDEFEDYLKATNKTDYESKHPNGKLIKALKKKAAEQKEYLRLTNPYLEALLYKWGSITTPINPVVLGMREQLRSESPTGMARTFDIQKILDEVFPDGYNR